MISIRRRTINGTQQTNNNQHYDSNYQSNDRLYENQNNQFPEDQTQRNMIYSRETATREPINYNNEEFQRMAGCRIPENNAEKQQSQIHNQTETPASLWKKVERDSRFHFFSKNNKTQNKEAKKSIWRVIADRRKQETNNPIHTNQDGTGDKVFSQSQEKYNKNQQYKASHPNVKKRSLGNNGNSMLNHNTGYETVYGDGKNTNTISNDDMVKELLKKFPKKKTDDNSGKNYFHEMFHDFKKHFPPEYQEYYENIKNRETRTETLQNIYKTNIFTAFYWMIIIFSIFYMIPGTQFFAPFIAGYVGGRKAGSTSKAVIASLIPFILLGIIQGCIHYRIIYQFYELYLPAANNFIGHVGDSLSKGGLESTGIANPVNSSFKNISVTCISMLISAVIGGNLESQRRKLSKQTAIHS